MKKIISLIIHNSAIYDFIYNMPCTNDNKDYSLNLIFDNNNNLIEIYYNKFNNSDINIDINNSYEDTFNGTSSQWTKSSDVTTLVNWKKYAKNWSEFCTLFPNLKFNNSLVEVSNSGGTNKQSNLSLNTNKINTTTPNLFGPFNKCFHWGASEIYSSWTGWANAYTYVEFYLWHDDNNIYWQYAAYNGSSFCAESPWCKIVLESCTIHNIMN